MKRYYPKMKEKDIKVKDSKEVQPAMAARRRTPPTIATIMIQRDSPPTVPSPGAEIFPSGIAVITN